MPTRRKGAKREPYPPHAKIETAGHELKKNPPAILAKTERKFGKAREERQRIAIMLNKARKGN